MKRGIVVRLLAHGSEAEQSVLVWGEEKNESFLDKTSIVTNTFFVRKEGIGADYRREAICFSQKC